MDFLKEVLGFWLTFAKFSAAEECQISGPKVQFIA